MLSGFGPPEILPRLVRRRFQPLDNFDNLQPLRLDVIELKIIVDSGGGR